MPDNSVSMTNESYVNRMKKSYKDIKIYGSKWEYVTIVSYCKSETLLCDVMDFLYILTRFSRSEPTGTSSR